MDREAKTPISSLEATRRYRMTKKGVIRNNYAGIKERCTLTGRSLTFSSDQLLCWTMNKPEFHEIYNEWWNSGFKKELRPSFDRIDPLGGYTFDNIQIVTHKFNRDKGDKEKEILWGKAIIQMDKSGNEIAKFPSIKAAVRTLGLRQSLISRVCAGKKKHTGGFGFKFDNNIPSGHPRKHRTT